MSLETVLYGIALLAGIAPLLWRAHRPPAGAAAAIALALLAVAGAAVWKPRIWLPPIGQRPLHVREGTLESPRGYVSSKTCRACHPGEYASWHRTYHRTMTQVVTPATVIGDFNQREITLRGQSYRFERRGNEFWARLPDPSFRSQQGPNRQQQREVSPASPSAPPVWRQIVMSTGLHHHQDYWYPSGSGRELHLFPLVYLVEQQRWVPRAAVFLAHPNVHRETPIWNFDCIRCHSTDGRPTYPDPEAAPAGAPDTRIAEAGIACEACHGPAAEHLQVNRNFWRRYQLREVGRTDLTIVHPGRVDAEKSGQICGQCHSVNYPLDEASVQQWMADGPVYRAGDDLRDSRHVIRKARMSEAPEFIRRQLQAIPWWFDEVFWPDGMIRVTGREYNGLLDSPCYRGGKFSCLSCHSMHASDPDDQLARGMETDQACLQCHESFRGRIAEHTRHAAESSGSRCYNCHMPNTTYGLLKASRSHTIDNPSVAASVETGRPNACNACHLNQTLAWTAKYLNEWYGAPPVALTGDQRNISAALLWLLRGDAAQRALTAWSMGWEPALQASGKDWLAPFLARTLSDPYDAVRYISGRSLRRLPGFEAFHYDYVAAEGQLVQSSRQALDLWRRRGDLPPDATGRQILIAPDGALIESEVVRLLQQRDDRAMSMAE